jgi:hypothetical protein
LIKLKNTSIKEILLINKTLKRIGFLLYMNALWTKRQFTVDLLYMYVLWTKRQLTVDLHSCYRYIKTHRKNTIDLLWMQTHCIVNDTVAINCLHCRWHCSTLRALPLLCFWSRIASRGVVFFVFSAKSCWVWLRAIPKSLPKCSNNFGSKYVHFYLFFSLDFFLFSYLILA